MNDGLSKGWRDRVIDWAVGKSRLRELHLFGSRARGDYGDESDVDIAYVLTGGDPGEVLAYSICDCRTWEDELQEIIGMPVHLEMADPINDIVVWPAVRDHGQLLYRKSGYVPVE